LLAACDTVTRSVPKGSIEQTQRDLLYASSIRVLSIGLFCVRRNPIRGDAERRTHMLAISAFDVRNKKKGKKHGKKR
jgi:hypothetical protein